MARPPVRLPKEPTANPESIVDLPQLDAIVEATAVGVHTPSWICATYGITLDTYNALLATPEIAARIAEAKRELYTNPGPARVRRKAVIAVETALPALVDTIYDANTPASARVNAAAELARLAGVRNETAEGRAATGAERVVVNIVLSDETVQLIESKAEPVEQLPND
jgi:hypothetical protein